MSGNARPHSTPRHRGALAGSWRLCLLPRHCDLKTLVGRDQVVMIVLLQVNLDPVDRATELVAARAVIRRYGRAALLADIARFTTREHHRDGHVDAAFAIFHAVHEERDGAPLGQPATVVLELH